MQTPIADESATVAAALWTPPTALNTKQASDYTGLATATLEKLRCTGGGPAFISYSRRAIRYRVSDLDTWMNARTVHSTSERLPHRKRVQMGVAA